MIDSLAMLKEKLTLSYSPVQEIQSPLLTKHQVRLYIKRDDMLDIDISGNKWRKLKYNLLAAKKQNYTSLLSFGGAYSNHIVALAAAGQRFGFATIGVIRGEQSYENNSSLSYARSCGMTLHFVTREQYRNKTDPGFLDGLKKKYGQFYLLPEGGSNHLALEGCSEIVLELEQQLEEMPDYVVIACGTAGTLSGLITSKQKKIKYIGVAVLKNAGFLDDDVREFLQSSKSSQALNWSINTDYHFGGYAKYSEKLIDFIQGFNENFGVQLEPVYTGKMFYALFDLLEQGFFPAGCKIVAVHTGGLQGLNGLPSAVRSKILGH